MRTDLALRLQNCGVEQGSPGSFLILGYEYLRKDKSEMGGLRQSQIILLSTIFYSSTKTRLIKNILVSKFLFTTGTTTHALKVWFYVLSLDSYSASHLALLFRLSLAQDSIAKTLNGR